MQNTLDIIAGGAQQFAQNVGRTFGYQPVQQGQQGQQGQQVDPTAQQPGRLGRVAGKMTCCFNNRVCKATGKIAAAVVTAPFKGIRYLYRSATRENIKHVVTYPFQSRENFSRVLNGVATAAEIGLCYSAPQYTIPNIVSVSARLASTVVGPQSHPVLKTAAFALNAANILNPATYFKPTVDVYGNMSIGTDAKVYDVYSKVAAFTSIAANGWPFARQAAVIQRPHAD